MYQGLQRLWKQTRLGWRYVRGRKEEMVQAWIFEGRQILKKVGWDVLQLLRADDIRPIVALVVASSSEPLHEGARM